MHNIKRNCHRPREMWFLAAIAPNIICNTVCTIFNPLFDIFTQFLPKESQPYSIKCLVLSHVFTTRACMIVTEKLTTQRNRDYNEYNMPMIS